MNKQQLSPSNRAPVEQFLHIEEDARMVARMEGEMERLHEFEDEEEEGNGARKRHKHRRR